MRICLICFALVLLVSISDKCICQVQARTITGRVIEENDLLPMPGVIVQANDTARLGTTDGNGNFKVEIPFGTDKLRFVFIGMESIAIEAPTTCDKVEIIMMVDAIYDYSTINAENRKRYKRFKELPKKHHQAYVNGIFVTSTPCFPYIFHKH